MLTPTALPCPVPDVPIDRIPEVRAALIAEGEALVTRADGADLSAEDTELFRAIESTVGTLDYRARVAAHQRTAAASPLMQGLVRASAGAGGAVSGRRIGNLPGLALTDENAHELYDAFRTGRPATIETTTAPDAFQTRDVTNVPMAEVPGQMMTPVAFRREPTRIAAFMPAQATESASVTYYTQPTAAGDAATVLEGADKPESTPGWTAVTAPIRKIAHYVEVSQESLDDYADFLAVVASEMGSGVVHAENGQLLNGNGTAPNLRGLLNTVGILTYVPAGAEARYRSLRIALRSLRSGDSFVDADTIVLNPADALVFDLSNDTANGLHAVDTLAGGPAATAWGARIVVTTAIAAGTALVMNAAEAGVVFVRQPPTITVDPYSRSTANMVRIFCEERLGLGVVRPTAICRVTFNGTI